VAVANDDATANTASRAAAAKIAAAHFGAEPHGLTGAFDPAVDGVKVPPDAPLLSNGCCDAIAEQLDRPLFAVGEPGLDAGAPVHLLRQREVPQQAPSIVGLPEN
ncbi:unnamed protein product, partial [Phaeothamnion confervicola]